jgi:hypothetical protein
MSEIADILSQQVDIYTIAHLPSAIATYHFAFHGIISTVEYSFLIYIKP